MKRCRGANIEVQSRRCRGAGAGADADADADADAGADAGAEVLSGGRNSAEVVMQVIVQVQRFCSGSAEVLSEEHCRGAEVQSRCWCRRDADEQRRC